MLSWAVSTQISASEGISLYTDKLDTTEYVMTAGSAMLSVSICLNALSDHGACTGIFVAVAFVVIFALSSVRTLGRISFIAMVGVACIIVASK